MKVVAASITPLVNVMWCEKCESGAVAMVEITPCPECGSDMTTIGWYEKAN